MKTDMDLNLKIPRIIAVNELNDYSGGPFVFSQTLHALQQQGYEIHLFTATPTGNGFLNEIWGVYQHSLSYHSSRNKWVNRIWFLWRQLFLFFRVLIFSHSGDIIYINSMFPFSAAIAGRLRGCKVLYHIHEVSVQPVVLKKFLLFVINHTASHCLYVSNYAIQHTNSRVAGTVVTNALPLSFIERVMNNHVMIEKSFTVLMLCSLKKYKGINEFVQCAMRLPEMKFELVLNASREAIDDFFAESCPLPSNLHIHDAQSNVHPFYANASVVVNLSLPDKWIEPFGMTALEAMYYRKPVIVPIAGGIADLVENNINGFCVDANDIDAVVKKIQLLSSDSALYIRMSNAAYAKASKFTQKKFRQSIIQTIHKLRANQEKVEDINLSLNTNLAEIYNKEERENNDYMKARYPGPIVRFWNDWSTKN